MWRREWGMGAAEHTSHTDSMRADGTHSVGGRQNAPHHHPAQCTSWGRQAEPHKQCPVQPSPPSHPTPQYKLPSSATSTSCSADLHALPPHTTPSTSQAISSFLPLSATSSITSCSTSAGTAPTAADPTAGGRRRQLLQACQAYINVVSYITLQVRVIKNEECRAGCAGRIRAGGGGLGHLNTQPSRLP